MHICCCGGSMKKEKGIFGSKLEHICPDTYPRVPEFVICCIEAIESKKENMTTEGIYRRSGNFNRVQKLKTAANHNNLALLKKGQDVHCLTGVLRMFLRELQDPVIPFHLFQSFLQAGQIKSHEARIDEFRKIIAKLPECNRQTLKYILKHLLRVAANSEKNSMHILNIAMALSPTLLVEPTLKSLPSAQILQNQHMQQIRVIEVLLVDFNEIFKQ